MANMCRILSVSVVCVVVVIMSTLTYAKPATTSLAELQPDEYHGRSSLLLFILRQLCRRYQQNGVTPLPSFCWIFNTTGKSPKPEDLDRYYAEYLNLVPEAETRQQDLQAAQAALDPDTVEQPLSSSAAEAPVAHAARAQE